MDTENIIKLLILVVLLLLSGFFSSAETAFTTLRRARVQSLAEEGSKRAALVLRILEDPGRMISAILIGNNIVNISASALMTVVVTELVGSWAVGLFTGLLTLLVLVFGEILPKTLAMLNNEKIAFAYAPAIRLLTYVLLPFILITDIISNLLLRMLHVSPDNKLLSISEKELLHYVDTGHEEGVIESSEKEMIHNMFEFTDAQARDIMIPRVNMVSIDIHSSFEDIKKLYLETMYTRLPVYDETPDKIIGFLNVKDLLFADENSFHLNKLIREVYYTYEYKNLADLMEEMRDKNMAVSIVLNEYGTTEGMITMEDLLEEVVGQIRDEYDADEAELIMNVGEREYIVDGSVNLDDINDALDTAFESEDYDSISGIIIEKLGDRLPEAGETVILNDGTSLKVEALDNNRIVSVRLTLPEKNEPDTSSEEA
ncbi:MAG: hemolysin family protein [Lachnospiraceae bacterium]|nr:hemolysin family protein [Lachnospiraceae bacterium]